MGDENPIRTLGDYSKPSHEGYRNTIELPVGNNVVPLRSDTIRLVQNGCSFHGLRSEDPNQHLKDFLKLVDSLDLDGENRERTRLRLFQFSLRDQASNWLERLPAGSITTWEDLTTRFLAQFFPPGRTVKLRNDILMFQQHHGESLSEAWTLFPHDTQYCMEDPEQAFVEYASSRTDEAGEGLVSEFMASQDVRLSKFEADFKRQQSELINKIDIVLKAISDQIVCTLPSDMVKNLKLGTHPVLSAHSYPTIDPQCSTHIHSAINAITIHPKQPEESQDNEPDIGHEEKGCFMKLIVWNLLEAKTKVIAAANLKFISDIVVILEAFDSICVCIYSIVRNPWSSLIPLSRGSFDVIVGMDWLSKRKFVIVCHEKVVRIPLEGDEILQVHGERTQGVVKTLMNTKFRIDLVHGATSVAKSPYRLAPLEMQELSEQLRELQDKVLELLRKEKLYAKVTYLRFIANFSKIVKPITSLTERDQKYEWGAERKEAFQTLKNDLCDASINQM
ncbi:zinc finger, CCHC-type containing protein [Tanacetum coccineum]|uniref:Zinc finger, CCHC-type containing protein n=2 Tax=Tanacetum coccineum TaxID=301880 RepID=A0ABQ4Y570_9ASTR